MSAQERWDIVISITQGPMSPMGEQTLRGPVVRIGANPGPGGFRLTGYRGLDARQAVITAYDGTSVTVAPVGRNQVRMAPHPHVNWKNIDPIREPEYLSEGCAIHLGPIGRGATLQFHRCQRLGVWQQGRLASELEEAGENPVEVQKLVRAHQIAAGGDVAPEVIKARRATTLPTRFAPIWFGGLLMFMTVATAGLMALTMLTQREVASLGPDEEGLAFFESIPETGVEIPENLYGDLQDPFVYLIVRPNTQAAREQRVPGADQLAERDQWDEAFYNRVTASVAQHGRAWAFYRRLDAVRDDYAKVLLRLRDAGLPEVLASLPYTESRYKPNAQSQVCAKGYWQIMPEVANRVTQLSIPSFQVRDCRLSGNPAPYQPTGPDFPLAPPRNVARRGPYMRNGECSIIDCAVDDRTGLESSTAAAIVLLGEAWGEPEIARSGAAVQLTLLSHNAGLDDAPYGRGKTTNILPALRRYQQAANRQLVPDLYGRNITCPTITPPPGSLTCQGVLHAQTQHYGYTSVARHILAMCYYAKNYGTNEAFSNWANQGIIDGYCAALGIPEAGVVQAQ